MGEGDRKIMSEKIYATINLSVSNEEIISTKDAVYTTETTKVVVPTIVVNGNLNDIKKQLHFIVDKLYITAENNIKLERG